MDFKYTRKVDTIKEHWTACSGENKSKAEKIRCQA